MIRGRPLALQRCAAANSTGHRCMLPEHHRSKHLIMTATPTVDAVAHVLRGCELPETTALRGAALCITHGYDADEIADRCLATVNALMSAHSVLMRGGTVGGGGEALLHAFRPTFVVRGSA